MCNDYRLHVGAGTIADDFSSIKIRIRFPEGTPNIEPRDDIRISDVAPIVRAVENEGGGAPARDSAELVQRRWSWPGPNRRPVYNFRSENRELASGRCLIVADGFYEFTDPKDAKKKRKDKWLFTRRGAAWFCIAGLWRKTADVGEAFTMLTMAPGPDVASYHDRQIAILERDQWADWLDPAVPARTLLKPLPAGALAVEQVG